MLTDSDLIVALDKKARAGVTVRVIFAANPYGARHAPAEEQTEFTGSNMQCKLAPAQFEGRYVFDHAKYPVVDAAGSYGEAAGHLRKVRNAIPEAAERLREYGIGVLEGYTFVRAFGKGS